MASKGDKAKLVLAILGDRKPKKAAAPKDSGRAEEKAVAVQEFAEALASKDYAGAAEAFQALYDLCAQAYEGDG